MPSTAWLLPRLKADYPQFSFKPADRFLWSPAEKTIYFSRSTDSDDFLLHELCHGLLGHASYDYDVELIAMERSAWDEAAKLARDYGLAISNDLIQATLDTYRDWMHARSTCPSCSAIGLQTKPLNYACPACRHQWRVNEARICALRRSDVN